MTDHDIHAIAGKTREDYRSAKRELAALKANAEELAALAGQLQQALENPSRILFWDGSPVAGQGWHRLSEALFEKLTAENVRGLAERVKAVEQRKQTLRQRIFEMEGEYPDTGDGDDEPPKTIRVRRMTGRR